MPNHIRFLLLISFYRFILPVFRHKHSAKKEISSFVSNLVLSLMHSHLMNNKYVKLNAVLIC